VLSRRFWTCQGGCRGFDPRFPLQQKLNRLKRLSPPKEVGSLCTHGRKPPQIGTPVEKKVALRPRPPGQVASGSYPPAKAACGGGPAPDISASEFADELRTNSGDNRGKTEVRKALKTLAPLSPAGIGWRKRVGVEPTSPQQPRCKDGPLVNVRMATALGLGSYRLSEAHLNQRLTLSIEKDPRALRGKAAVESVL